MQQSEEPKKPRRVRYSGTHPKTYKEKYKELQPDQYQGEVAKILAQGKTPAGMHRSICVDEILEALQLQAGQVGLDATLGFGGHSIELVQRVLPGGKLFAIDVDSIEMPKTRERLAQMGYGPEHIDIRKLNFSSADLVSMEAGLLDFIVADLGVSSMQIDNPDRGFSFKVDGPLDLRLNPNSGKSAAALLKSITVQDLERLLVDNSDEPFAQQIANAIVNARQQGIWQERTSDLFSLVKTTLEALPQKTDADTIKKTCQRCFQALRIAVNDEFRALDKFLDKIPTMLKPGGRVAILSFHSGEDRRVKKSFQTFERQGVYASISTDCIRPSLEECTSNPRSKSAKLRWAIKR
jgi:16S rRNA (cytosine1402-N4)-methyltransferase